MPSLSPKIFDCVFYLYRRNPQTGKIDGPWGTGSFLTRISEDLPSFQHHYGVTNWHVSNQLGASIIRVNTKDGGTRFIEYDPSDWHFLPGHDDLSVVDLGEDLRPTDQINVNAEDSLMTPEVMKEFEIDIGEDLFMGGLYPNQHGGKRNKPCGRFGNIAMLPDENSLVKQPNGNRRPSFLADMRSRSGFSGSPVFIYRVPTSNLRNPWRDLKSKSGFAGAPTVVTVKDKFLGVLGIHCGQFWDKLKARKADPSEQAGDPIKEGDNLYVEGAMTIIVPAWRISEVLDLEVLEMARKARERKALEGEPIGEAVEAPPAKDANPEHLKDFMALVGAAARKRPQGD